MTNRTKKLIKIGSYILGVLAVILIMDRVVMPYYVKLGEEIIMPKVTGLVAEEAKQLLESRGFQVIFQDSTYSGIHPEGTVINQNPYDSAMVKTGRRVYLTISIGEKPAMMPDLIGQSLINAELRLKSARLDLGRVGKKTSSTVWEGLVAEQSYPVGQQLKPHTKVDVKISVNQVQNILPSLEGMSLEYVQKHLEGIGLRIGKVTYEENNNLLQNTVISQSPAAGSAFKNGDSVDLVVSKLKPKE